MSNLPLLLHSTCEPFPVPDTLSDKRNDVFLRPQSEVNITTHATFSHVISLPFNARFDPLRINSPITSSRDPVIFMPEDAKILSFNLFCYVLSVSLYCCLGAPIPATKSMHDSSEMSKDPYQTLKDIRVSNVDRLIFGQLNINSLRNKFETLKLIVKVNLDILIITESKLDDTFPTNQFIIHGVIIYVRDDIPCREMKTHTSTSNLEGIFFEINLKISKWLVFGGYDPHKDNISNFMNQLGPCLDHYMAKYDNFLLLQFRNE